MIVPVVVTDPPPVIGTGTGVGTGVAEGEGEALGEGEGSGVAEGEGLGVGLGTGVGVGVAVGEGVAEGVGVGVADGVDPPAEPKRDTASVAMVAGVADIAVPPVAVVTATELVKRRSQTISPSLVFTFTLLERM